MRLRWRRPVGSTSAGSTARIRGSPSWSGEPAHDERSLPARVRHRRVRWRGARHRPRDRSRRRRAPRRGTRSRAEPRGGARGRPYGDRSHDACRAAARPSSRRGVHRAPARSSRADRGHRAPSRSSCRRREAGGDGRSRHPGDPGRGPSGEPLGRRHVRPAQGADRRVCAEARPGGDARPAARDPHHDD